MAKNSGGSFFSRLFSSLFSGGDPEAEKKKLLKAIAKDLARTHNKFYKSNSMQPSFGKFFYEIYKVASPVQAMFMSIQNPNALKNMVVDYSLSENQKKLIENLNEDSINTMSSNMPFSELKTKIKNDMDSFMGEFDSAKITGIDTLYQKLMAFKAFCTYDYYFILKKFDSSLHENDFNHTPKFEPIEAAYVAEDLKDFATVMYSLPLDSQWDDLMAMFKTVRGIEPVKPAVWNKLVNRLRQLKNSRVFDMIIELASRDPKYYTQAETKKEQIVETYIEKIRSQVNVAIKKLENDQTNSKIDSLLTQIFNTNVIVVLKNYSDTGSAPFEKKNLGSFQFSRPLNYLKAFLVEYAKRDIREYGDLVLVRGKWTNNTLSGQMSEDYHILLDTSDAITAFDNKLAEDAEIGMKFKTLLPRCERDKEAQNIIRTLLRDTNSEAREYLVSCTKSMISFAKNIKALLDDHQKQRPEMVINWKELDRFAEHPVQQLGVEIYKKIYLFVNLMQKFLGAAEK